MRKATKRRGSALAVIAAGDARGQSAGFEPGKLAVLRVGDGGEKGGASDLTSVPTTPRPISPTSSVGVRTGCFGLAVDFSGSHPVLYATTTDFVGYKGKNVNSNRLMRIDDTNTATGGVTITNFARTLATAEGTNISFRAIAFTPEAKP